MTRSKFLQQVFVGNDVTNSLAAIPPQSNDGTKITGIGINRVGANSGKLIFAAAAASGAPDAAVTALVIEHSDTLGSGYTTFKTLESALDIDAAGVNKEYALDLQGVKTFVRVTVDTTYTGGTSPANIVCAQLILGDYDVDPKTAETVYAV